MKYIKRLALNRKNQQENRFAVEADDRIVTTSRVSLQLPSGATSDRPSPIDGMVRYNTTIHEGEIYNIDGEGTGWEKIKTNRQGTITPQSLGVGNYINTIFGPLAYDISTSKPQNVMVFIDNVYQIPVTNYTLIPGTSVAVTATIAVDVLSGATTITLNTTTNILVGQTVTGPSGLAGATTVTNVDNVLHQITINPPTTDSIPNGQQLSFSEQAGTFIEFNGAVPAKQVFALLGFDGYAP
jgi:hypothetical protein